MRIETIETREDLEICLDCLNEWHDSKSDLIMHFSSEGELMMTAFSKTPCENCGSKLGGYRFTATRRVCN